MGTSREKIGKPQGSISDYKECLKKEEASKFFKKTIEGERRIWEDKQADRTEEAQEETILQVREANLDINPADVPIAALVPRFFLSMNLG